MRQSSRVFAVIPAAGLSRRMGRPKLLLTIGGCSVISRLLETLAVAGVTASVVVGRRGDADLWREVEHTAALAVRPDVDPPEMRVSVEHALAAIQQRWQPSEDDGWLLVPADHPVLDAVVVGELIAHWRASKAEILIPTYRGERGHPTLLRWSLAAEVLRIPSDRGLNWLVRSNPARVTEIEVTSDAVVMDLDTPEDFERLLRRTAGQS